ncbi:MAG: molybdenum cofactor guanylyltransferase [Dehalococcoidia bacterium]
MNNDDKFNDVTGVILAGGRSTRMGRDKAMLRVGEDGGVTLFERLLELMQALFPKIIIAGDRPDLCQIQLPCYPDRYPGSALGGLYTGLFEANSEMIFVSPCDLAFPDPKLARLILAQRRDYDVVVPKTPAGIEPLFALYRKSCLEHMRNMLERSEYRIYDFFPQVRVRYMGVEELPSDWQWSLMNINTPEDYCRMKERNL